MGGLFEIIHSDPLTQVKPLPRVEAFLFPQTLSWDNPCFHKCLVLL